MNSNQPPALNEFEKQVLIKELENRRAIMSIDSDKLWEYDWFADKAFEIALMALNTPPVADVVECSQPMTSNQLISDERLEWLLISPGPAGRDEQNEIVKELLELRKANAWVGVDAGMPKDETVVLVRDEKDIIWCAEVDHGQFYPDEFHRIEGCREITHWMELPKPPAPEPE